MYCHLLYFSFLFVDFNIFFVQSEERGTPSRRSKSEGPYRITNGDAYPVGDTVDKPNGHPKTGSKVRQLVTTEILLEIHELCIKFDACISSTDNLRKQESQTSETLERIFVFNHNHFPAKLLVSIEMIVNTYTQRSTPKAFFPMGHTERRANLLLFQENEMSEDTNDIWPLPNKWSRTILFFHQIKYTFLGSYTA